MGFIQYYKEQVEVIKDRDPAIKTNLEALLYPSFWAIYKYRKAHKLYEKGHVFRARMISQRAARKTGIEIHPAAQIGKGLFIAHPYGITINDKCIIGMNCNIHKGVTIGQENRGKRQGTPIIGDNVWIGMNVTIVGNIKIGNDVLIAPNTYLNCDVPSHSIVLGNPARIIVKDNATSEYINNIVGDQ